MRTLKKLTAALLAVMLAASLCITSLYAAAEDTVDYYLFGWINGANYACEGDYQNLGEYKFVDGQLTATFTEDSYVAVKTGDNANWYMTDGYPGDEAKTATLYKSPSSANKLRVPGNVLVTFTLVVNDDDTLTLSYTVPEEETGDETEQGKTVYFYDDNNSYNGYEMKYADFSESYSGPCTTVEITLLEDGRYKAVAPSDMVPSYVKLHDGEGNYSENYYIYYDYLDNLTYVTSLYEWVGFYAGAESYAPCNFIASCNSSTGEEVWDPAYVYYWSDSDENMVAWPGIKMGGSNYPYEVYIPTCAQYVIFNNGSGKQTGNIDMPEDPDTWSSKIYSQKYEKWVDYGSQEASGSIDVAETYTIYIADTDWENLNVYYWNDKNSSMTTWPGKAATFYPETDSEYAHYEFEIPEIAQYVIFNNGSEQTGTINLPSNRYGATLYSMEQEEWLDSSERYIWYMDYYLIDTDWEKVYVYYWSDSRPNMVEEPGEEATYYGSSSYYVPRFCVSVPETAQYVYFTNGEGERTETFNVDGQYYYNIYSAEYDIWMHDYDVISKTRSYNLVDTSSWTHASYWSDSNSEKVTVKLSSYIHYDTYAPYYGFNAPYDAQYVQFSNSTTGATSDIINLPSTLDFYNGLRCYSMEKSKWMTYDDAFPTEPTEPTEDTEPTAATDPTEPITDPDEPTTDPDEPTTDEPTTEEPTTEEPITEEPAPAEEGKANWYGYSVSFSGNIGLNLYIELPDSLSSDAGTYMKFTLPGSSTPTEVPLSDALKVQLNGKTYYRFSCGVAAKEMTGEIKAVLVNSEGSEVSDERCITLKNYADIIIGRPDKYTEKQINLLKAMLNYSGYAQEYFGYKTDDLANDGLNLDLPDPEIDDSYKTNRTANTDTIKYAGSSLIMETETKIRHYFYLTGDISDFDFACNDTKLTPVYTGTNNLYYVDIKNISAKNLGTMYKLIINDGEYEISYSPYTYIKLITEGNYNEKTKNLVRALYQYGEAAKAYFVG